MLSKQEQKDKNKEFWSGFKEYMRKTPSANGKRMNWLNYPTDLKDVYLRLYASNKGCALNFDIQCKDLAIREIVWEQLTELKVVLEKEMQFETVWNERYFMDDGLEIGRISWTNEKLNYFNTTDIPLIYAFLKARITEFDRFYQEYKDILINLMD